MAPYQKNTVHPVDEKGILLTPLDTRQSVLYPNH